jgi:hypothetical protein
VVVERRSPRKEKKKPRGHHRNSSPRESAQSPRATPAGARPRFRFTSGHCSTAAPARPTAYGAARLAFALSVSSSGTTTVRGRADSRGRRDATRRTRSTGRWLARRRAPSLRASLATAVPSRRHASPGARVRATQPAARRRFQPRPSMDTRRRRAQSRATPTGVRWVQPCRHQAKASAPQQQEAKRRLTREESICPRGKNGCFFDAGRGRRVRQWPPMIPRLATPDRRQVLLLVLCSKGGRTKGPGNLAGRMRIGRGAFASTSLAARAVAM